MTLTDLARPTDLEGPTTLKGPAALEGLTTPAWSVMDANKALVKTFLTGTHPNGDSCDIEESLKVIDVTVSEKIRCHGFPGGDPVDRESYKAFFRNFQAGFTSIDFVVLSMVADSENVMVRWQLAAIHSGDFAGIAATGNKVSFTGMVQYHILDGLIAETWLQMDQLALLQGIGAVPLVPANDQ